jgi:uncharacterized protein YdaU (DUF1376 family)
LKRPAFQLYVNDWLSSTAIALMSAAEEGAYIHLLCHEWTEDDCGLPDDDAQLAVLSRLGRDWKKSSACLRKQFMARDGRLYNKKLLAVRDAADAWREKQRESGKRGAQKRWGGDGEPMAPPPEKNGEPMAPPPEKNGEPIARARDSSSSASASASTTARKPPSSTAAPLRGVGTQLVRGWFGEFWTLYWRRVGKIEAQKLFMGCVKSEADWDRVRDAVIAQTPEMMAREPSKRPYPATWLSRGSMHDEPAPPASGAAPVDKNQKRREETLALTKFLMQKGKTKR